MPIEIRELIIRASVDPQREDQTDTQPPDNPDAGRKRERELEALKKMIEQKNER